MSYPNDPNFDPLTPGPANVLEFRPIGFRVGQVVTHKTQPYLRMVVTEVLKDPALAFRPQAAAAAGPVGYMCAWLTPDGRRLDRFGPAELLGGEE